MENNMSDIDAIKDALEWFDPEITVDISSMSEKEFEQTTHKAIQTIRAALSRGKCAVSDVEEIKLEWRKGEPPRYYRREWFIAKTKHRDRVVLRELPEEMTYDYKTADETYIKADQIVAWMQFPDSEFVEPEYESRSLKEKIHAYNQAMLSAAPKVDSGWRSIETAPKDEEIKLRTPFLECIGFWDTRDGDWFFSRTDEEYTPIPFEPTEWKPTEGE